MRKLFVAACCGLALLLSVTGCCKKKKQIKVQYINASPGSPYLDYYLQGTKRASFTGYNICSNSNTADLLDGEACIAEARLDNTKITALKFTDWKVGERYIMVTYNDYSSLRTALLRHIEKDLGPLALPRLPQSLAPFTVAEYFPTPGVTPFHDPRQHAVSLAYVVPVDGDCEPQQDALELTWFSPAEVLDPGLLAEMSGGQGTLVRQALAHVGM